MLTPIDIHNKQHKAGRGYSKKEMDEFLEQIAEDYETLYKENRELKDKLEKLSDGVQYYKSMEGTLQKALVLAEKTSKDTIESANEKAQLIIKEAQFKADQLINEGNSHFESLRQQCLTLVQQYNQFKLQFKQIAIKQIELFDSDFYEIYTNDFLSKLNESIDSQPVNNTSINVKSEPTTVPDNEASEEKAAVKEQTVTEKKVEFEEKISEEEQTTAVDSVDIVSEPTIELPPLGNTKKFKPADSESDVKDITSHDEDDLETLIKDLRKELSVNVNDKKDKKSAFEFLDSE